jgi:hypothetical protein
MSPAPRRPLHFARSISPLLRIVDNNRIAAPIFPLHIGPTPSRGKRFPHALAHESNNLSQNHKIPSIAA